jgi:hypothetical protein
VTRTAFCAGGSRGTICVSFRDRRFRQAVDRRSQPRRERLVLGGSLDVLPGQLREPGDTALHARVAARL